MNRLILVPWLLVLWLMLWRDLSPANVLSGLAVATVVCLGLRLDWTERTGGRRWVRPWPLVRFLGFFAWKLVEANLVLALEIVTPRNRIQTGVIAVSMRGYSDVVVTVTANAVSLTPGTLSIEVSGGESHTIYVHVLHLHDIARARRDVYALAERAAAALGDDVRGMNPEETPR